jgi:hypothetical protein
VLSSLSLKARGMIESILVGAGSKLIFNLANSFFYGREKREERKKLKTQAELEAHIELAKITNKNLISNLTRSMCALMIFGTWCFIGVYAMLYPTVTDVLIPIKHGIISKLVNQPEAVVVEGRTPGILFQAWFEVTIAFVTMFSLHSRRR